MRSGQLWRSRRSGLQRAVGMEVAAGGRPCASIRNGERLKCVFASTRGVRRRVELPLFFGSAPVVGGYDYSSLVTLTMTRVRNAHHRVRDEYVPTSVPSCTNGSIITAEWAELYP